MKADGDTTVGEAKDNFPAVIHLNWPTDRLGACTGNKKWLTEFHPISPTIAVWSEKGICEGSSDPVWCEIKGFRWQALEAIYPTESIPRAKGKDHLFKFNRHPSICFTDDGINPELFSDMSKHTKLGLNFESLLNMLRSRGKQPTTFKTPPRNVKSDFRSGRISCRGPNMIHVLMQWSNSMLRKPRIKEAIGRWAKCLRQACLVFGLGSDQGFPRHQLHTKMLVRSNSVSVAKPLELGRQHVFSSRITLPAHGLLRYASGLCMRSPTLSISPRVALLTICRIHYSLLTCRLKLDSMPSKIHESVVAWLIRVFGQWYRAGLIPEV